MEERERKVEKEDVKKERDRNILGWTNGWKGQKEIYREREIEREREIGDVQRNRGKERRNKRWSIIARLFW